jgi:hypothetical protein
LERVVLHRRFVVAARCSIKVESEFRVLLLAHEVGHNLWCAHDRANNSGPTYSDYSFGFREPGNAWLRGVYVRLFKE